MKKMIQIASMFLLVGGMGHLAFASSSSASSACACKSCECKTCACTKDACKCPAKTCGDSCKAKSHCSK